MNQQPVSWPPRLYALDVSRGLAALTVVLWHWQHFYYQGYQLPNHFDRSIQPLFPILKFFYLRGELGVDYFFILSGFIFFWLYRSPIQERSLGFGSFWLQRFSRLYPLHLLTLLLVALLQSIYRANTDSYFVWSHNDRYHFLLHLGFAAHWGFQEGYAYNGPIWSVSIEILLYLMFFAIARYSNAGPKICLALSLVAYALFMTFVYNFILRGMAMYFLGGAIFHLTQSLSKPAAGNGRSLMYGFTITAWIMVIVNFYIEELVQPLTSMGFIGHVVLSTFTKYVLLPSTVCSLALWEITTGPKLRRLAWVGDITYASYLLHFPLQLTTAILITQGLLSTDCYRQPVGLLAFFAVLVVVSLLCYAYIERPAQRWLRRRLSKQPTATEIPPVATAK